MSAACPFLKTIHPKTINKPSNITNCATKNEKSDRSPVGSWKRRRIGIGEGARQISWHSRSSALGRGGEREIGEGRGERRRRGGEGWSQGAEDIKIASFDESAGVDRGRRGGVGKWGWRRRARTREMSQVGQEMFFLKKINWFFVVGKKINKTRIKF